jgi:hypothetical protein
MSFGPDHNTGRECPQSSGVVRRILSAASVAVQVGNTLYVGSAMGDRLLEIDLSVVKLTDGRIAMSGPEQVAASTQCSQCSFRPA